jgi:hypothetical protein
MAQAAQNGHLRSLRRAGIVGGAALPALYAGQSRTGQKRSGEKLSCVRASTVMTTNTSPLHVGTTFPR